MLRVCVSPEPLNLPAVPEAVGQRDLQAWNAPKRTQSNPTEQHVLHFEYKFQLTREKHHRASNVTQIDQELGELRA